MLHRAADFMMMCLLLLLNFGLFAGLLFGAFATGLTSSRHGWILSALFVFVSVWVAVVTLIRMNWHGHSAPKRKTIRVMLQHKLCPACGEDLKDNEPDDEGLTCCPRCVARWRISEPVS